MGAGNVEKLSITKSPSLKFCLNGLETIGLDYFISVCYKRTVCCCNCILKENEGRRTRPQIWYWEANAIIVPRFYHIHRRSVAKIVAASGQVKIVQKSICAGSPEELTAFHQTLLEGRGLAASSPRTPPRLGPSGLGSSLILQCPPLEKSCGRP